MEKRGKGRKGRGEERVGRGGKEEGWEEKKGYEE